MITRFTHKKTGVAMGAKFAPIMANLFMAKWKDDIIYAIPSWSSGKGILMTLSTFEMEMRAP